MIGTDPSARTAAPGDSIDPGAIYDFPPPETRGVVLGVSWSQLAVMAASLLVGTLILQRLVPPAMSSYVVCASLAAGAVLAFVPVRGGHHLGEWAMLRVRHGLRPHVARRRGDLRAIAHVLPRVSLHAHEEEGSARGVLREQHRASEATYLMAIQMPGTTRYVLGSPEERAGIESRWGLLLATAVRERSPISRLQVLARTAPSSDNGHASWLATVADPRSPFYEAAWEDALQRPAPVDHEAFLMVQIALSRCRQTKRRGAGDVDRGAMAILSDEVDRIVAELQEIELGARVLSPRGLAGVIRNAYDPDARRQLSHEVEWDTVSPTYEEEALTHYQAQQHYHATLAIRAWPRTSVRSGFALPLLLWTKAAHAFSVVYEPVPPSRSLAQAERAATDDLGESLTKERWGFRDKARKHLERRGIARREQELSGGHQEYRFAGYLTVSVRSAGTHEATLARLDEAVVEAEDRARHSGGMDAQLLVAEQAEGFRFTLPLCRGL
jgi:hypothetical protein